MAFQKKCPLCSSKMSKVNGVLTCPDCGYNESFSHSSYTTSSSGETTSTTANTNAGGSSRSMYQNAGQTGGSQRPYEQYLNQSQGSNTASNKSFAEITAQRRAVYGDEKPKSSNRILLVCVALMIVFIAICVPVVSFFSLHHAIKTTHMNQKVKVKAQAQTGQDQAVILLMPTVPIKILHRKKPL